MDLFRPDNPVSIETEDRFQRYDFAQRIAQIISVGKRPSSVVVGIYGKWGEGKTSVINFIKRELPADVVVVNFNPWSFSDEKQLITAFFGTIAAALGKKLITGKNRALKACKEYADAIGVVSNLIYSGIGSLFTSGGKIAEKFQKNTIEDLKARIDDLIIEANSNFVIFIDDIDRLEAQEVQAIFRVVKLLGDFPRTAYVLSFDDEMAAAALGPKYGNRDNKSGYDFLEKIIQIPLQLPKANRQTLRTYTFDLLNKATDTIGIDLNENESADFVNKFDKAFLPALINPRLAVRYSNSISFSLPLLKGEVYLSDLIIIEGVKVFYPALYHFIRNSPELFVRVYSNTGLITSSATPEDKKAIKEAINKQLDIYEQKDKILSMIADLFPNLQNVLFSYGYDRDNPEEWYRKKRICSAHYFERYFSYVVQEGDISDVYFQTLLSELETETTESIYKRFEDALRKIKTETFVFKLKQFVPTFKGPKAIILATTLARLGNHFSKVQGIMFFSERDQVTSIIRDLLEPISKTEKTKACIDLLEQAQPLEFAMQIQGRFRAKPQYSHEPPFLDAGELKQIAEVLIERFINQSEKESIFEIMPDHYLWGMFELFLEAHKQKEVTNLLIKIIEDKAENALKIIKIFTPSIITSTHPTREFYKVHFKEDNYKSLKQFIEPSIVYDKTIEAFGKKNYIPVTEPEHDELTDDNLIGLFQTIHKEAVKEPS